MNKDICFVILHYGELSVTKTCIDSINRLDNHENTKIVLVDNDTKKSDDKRNELNDLFKDNKNIVILKMTGNTGFSKANNEGYKYVLENYKPKYIIVCNNDIEFIQKDTFKLIDEVYKETNFAVLGPDVIRVSDKVHQNPHAMSLIGVKEIEHSIKMNSFFLKHFNLLYPILYLYSKYENKQVKKMSDENLDKHDIRQDKAVLAGSIYIFSSLFFDKMSRCFFPETQFYSEEDILAYNCFKKDLKMIYDPSIIVNHESEASTRSTYKNMKNRLKFRLSMSIDSSKIYLDILKKDNYGQ